MAGNRGIRGNRLDLPYAAGQGKLHRLAECWGFKLAKQKYEPLKGGWEDWLSKGNTDMILSVHRSQPNMVGWTYLDLHVPPDSCFFIQGILSLSAAPVTMVMLNIETFPQAQHGWLRVISFSMNSARSQMSKPPEMNFVFRAVGKHPQHSHHSLGCLLHVPSQT